ncbi:MAG: c-type cytochrome [Chitinophagales bacterium]|nr:c-type cytochrome [Chitinophagales bacterium]
MARSIKILVIPILIFTTFISCEKNDTVNPMVRFPEGKGYEWLSDYNIFIGNLADINPNTEAGILPYNLNMALFSDYASKKRFVYVPEGSKINFDTTDVLNFPLGSILIKHFYYLRTDGSEDNIETRLLIRQTDAWRAETYIWNEDQSDAQRTIVGETLELTTFANGGNRTFNYLVPNQNQCKNCHSDEGKLEPVGPQAQNLHKDYPYDFGTANQLQTWMDRGILEDASLQQLTAWPKIDDASTSLNKRARAYLDVNCASCHHRYGSAANSGLYLETENKDSLSVGIWKSPVAAGAGSGGFSYVIHPGMGDQSILLYRMISLELDERMPEIGRDLIHDEGVLLIRDWIDTM